MKLIIDIPDKDYEFIKDLQTLVIGSRCSGKTIQYNLINAIKNGVPFNKAEATMTELLNRIYGIEAEEKSKEHLVPVSERVPESRISYLSKNAR